MMETKYTASEITRCLEPDRWSLAWVPNRKDLCLLETSLGIISHNFSFSITLYSTDNLQIMSTSNSFPQDAGSSLLLLTCDNVWWASRHRCLLVELFWTSDNISKCHYPWVAFLIKRCARIRWNKQENSVFQVLKNMLLWIFTLFGWQRRVLKRYRKCIKIADTL